MRDPVTKGARSPEICVVVPLFNEEDNVLELHRRLERTLRSLNVTYEILFIDDGSRDETAAILARLCETNPHVAAIHLSRNFGHQAAVTAGIDHGRGQRCRGDGR